MWSEVYRNHVIMAFPTFDTATSSWIPQADVTWCVGSARAFEFLRFSKRCASEAEAVSCGLAEARSWIDQRLARLHAGAELAGGTVIGVPPEKRTRLEAAALHRPAPQKSQQESLTYEQFKARLRQSGVNISEEQLLKSYAALVKLREQQHWSQDEALRKLEDSQRELSTGRSPAQHRIPLTPREWRRI
ncbi:MAG TPA: hypothetical protein VNL14_03550 [Candidatus Acidoferrales bacterium]|nr:hypothetical protein [Candidatus Acidoferrales bacterium]